MKVHLIRLARYVWAWDVFDKGEQVAGGYCRTKRDALNDGAAWIRLRGRE